jgi:hypothetical protein
MLKHDETVQRQSFDQAYKHFWSFVDFNAMFDNRYENDQFNKGTTNTLNNLNNKSHGESKSKNFNGTSNSGISNSNFSGKSNLTYQEARRRADELLGKSR